VFYGVVSYCVPLDWRNRRVCCPAKKRRFLIFIIIIYFHCFLFTRSVNSVLSDLSDVGEHLSSRHQQPTDFSEGMNMIHDALHPYVDEDETVPTTGTYNHRTKNGLPSFRRGHGVSPRISNDGRQ
jgi:hypothetical protein